MKDEFSAAIEQSRKSLEKRADQDRAPAEVLADRARAAAEDCTRKLGRALAGIPDLIVQQQPVQMAPGRHGDPAAQIELEGDRAEFTVSIRGQVQWLPAHGVAAERPHWELVLTINVKEGHRSTKRDVPGEFTSAATFDVDEEQLKSLILDALRSA